MYALQVTKKGRLKDYAVAFCMKTPSAAPGGIMVSSLSQALYGLGECPLLLLPKAVGVSDSL